MGEQTNSQSSLSEMKRCVILRVFSLYEPVAKIKLSKYSGRVWLLSLPFCIQTKMICKTECLLCPILGPGIHIEKRGKVFFFLLAVKKNILMHRHFWLCVKLSNPAPYFRLRYLLSLSFFSSRICAEFEQIFILHVHLHR